MGEEKIYTIILSLYKIYIERWRYFLKTKYKDKHKSGLSGTLNMFFRNKKNLYFR